MRMLRPLMRKRETGRATIRRRLAKAPVLLTAYLVWVNRHRQRRGKPSAALACAVGGSVDMIYFGSRSSQLPRLPIRGATTSPGGSIEAGLETHTGWLVSSPGTSRWKIGVLMNTTNTYLAVFLGSKTSARRAAWDALSEGDRRAKEQEGIAAWKAWVEKHGDAIVSMGGPLGKTKKVTQRGIEDTNNEMGAFTVVRADSHAAAAKIFEKHPHFSIFPGDGVEIMPVLPIPGA